MERNLERKTLSFGKGMTNVPSDLLSDDSELLESDGFIFRDGEMKPIQNPVKIGEIAGQKILYVHKMADYENIIAYDEDRTIYWYVRGSNGIEMPPSGVPASFEVGKVKDIKSVGNTLIVATEGGLHYLRYKGNKYKNLGTELPKPHLYPCFSGNNRLHLGGVTVCELEEIIEEKKRWAFYNNDNTFAGILYTDAPLGVSGNATKYYAHEPINDASKKQAFQNAIQGHVAASLNKVKETGRFTSPFFLRFALKLHDGSYVRISNPIAMFPTTNRNCYFVPVKYNSDTKNWEETSDSTKSFLMYPYYATLSFRAEIEGIEQWGDIVKELVVFASDEVLPFHLDDEFTFANADKTNGESYINTTRTISSSSPFPDLGIEVPILDNKFHFIKDKYNARDVILPTYKSDNEIIKELLSKTQFYKLFSVNVTDSYYIQMVEYRDAPIGRHVLENLLTQEQLQVDDYYGWTSMKANKSYTYNKRINLFDITRKPFKGFNVHNDLGYFGSNYNVSNKFVYYVHIESSTMDTWVKSDELSIHIPDYANSWFYYPDPNATEVIVWDNLSNKGMRIKLTVHPMLNGAYSFKKLPTADTFTPDASISEPDVDENACEYMNSQIFTSVVNNPFVFEASGDNTVGTGKILGIIANTEAVSQGQFGQYPLMVFTDEGIYGLSVNSEGLYSSSYPVSREVLNENSPLVPTDRLVYFASKKGLMAASGSQVACMSEQLRGRTPRNFISVGDGKFLEFLANCLIAYDYRDSLLRIFCQDKDYQYIYNMVDKTFSIVNSGMTVKAVVNDYPDNLIQDISGNVYSLMAKPDINDDTDNYRGSITTRPLKLGGSMNLKSLRAVKHLFDSDNGKIAMEIYGSNDCKHWCKLISLGGKPWKYFTFKYALTNFKATDSFAGSIVEVQNRREDKIR